MSNNTSINIRNIFTISSVIVLCLIALILTLMNSLIFAKFISLFACLLALLSIYEYRNNIYLLPFLIFNFIFTTPGIYVLIFEVEISVYRDFYNKTLFLNHNLTLFIFNFLLYIFSRHKTKTNVRVEFPNDPNRINFSILAIACIAITTFGMTGVPTLIGAEYGDLNKSTLYEYFIVFYTLLIYYRNRNSQDKYLIYLIAVYYAVKSILFGNRIEVVYVLLISFYAFLDDSKKRFNYSRFISLSILGYIASTIFGKIRGNPIALSELLNGNFSILLPSKGQRILSTEGDVFYSSTRIIGVVEELGLDFYDRVNAFINFLLTTIIPRKYLADYADLALFKKEIFASGGGGSIVTYFYVWFSFLGILILALLLRRIYVTLIRTQNNYAKLYCFMVLATFPRWYAYNPVILFKLCVSIIPLAYLLNIKFSNYK